MLDGWAGGYATQEGRERYSLGGEQGGRKEKSFVMIRAGDWDWIKVFFRSLTQSPRVTVASRSLAGHQVPILKAAAVIFLHPTDVGGCW